MFAKSKVNWGHPTHGQATGNQRNEIPRGNHARRSKKWKSKRSLNSWETKNVASKRWSEGQTGKKTHYQGKLLRDTQLHGNTGTRKSPHHGQSTQHGKRETVTINAIFDSEAKEDFMVREVCNKHGIKLITVTNPREINLVDGNPTAMGPDTHMTEVSINISSHRELAIFQVANLQKYEGILGMPWLTKHNPMIDWNYKKIIFNNKLCTKWYLNSSHVAYAIPEEKALEEYLITRF